MAKKSTTRQTAIIQGFRSGLEGVNAKLLETWNVPVQYEEFKLSYTKPARVAKYTPDFILPNGIVVETKGRFLTEDRQKHILIKTQHPSIDLRFVFSNPNTRISKQSKTTYAMWCETHGFLYAPKVIPQEWTDEDPKQERMDALTSILGWTPPKPSKS